MESAKDAREIMNCSKSPLFPDVLLVNPVVHGDSRGYFLESYQAERYAQAGMPKRFVQDNISCSRRGVLRGLHYQLRRPQGKLLWVIVGEVFDVVVDIRRGSPTWGKWFGVTLSDHGHQQIYVPEGFAHGFCVTSESAIVSYKCTDYYAPGDEGGIRWDDPTLAIPWPVNRPVLSEKDATYPALAEIPPDGLPQPPAAAG
jgi:dTDP-4-dehydrorhamnose 3,5-epimerase